MKPDKLEKLRANFARIYQEELRRMEAAKRSSTPVSMHQLREGYRRGRPVVERVDPRLPSAVKIGSTVARFSPQGIVTTPPELRGVRAVNLPRLGQDLIDDMEVERRQKDATGKLPGQTFMGPKQAIEGLSRANPGLFDTIGRLWGSYMDAEFAKWVADRMKGPKPTPMSARGDSSAPGRGLPNFDWTKSFTDKEYKAKGRKPRKIWSITEALYASIPSSRRWQDWMPFLQEMQRQINEAAREESYVEPWHEIRIPGRAGRVLAKAEIDAMLRSVGPEEIIEGYRQKARETAASGSQEVPF